MKESVTYQAILREGREEGQIAEAQRILLLLGEKRLGPGPPSARAAIESIHSVERLETLTKRVLDVENWDDLLAG